MTTEKNLQTRSDNHCELCKATEDLAVYEVAGAPNIGDDAYAFICQTCRSQLDNPDSTEAHHWHCLNDSMWSQVPAVQVLAWRMLTRLSAEGWPQDLLDMLYLDDEMLAWAKSTGEGIDEADQVKHLDSNGALLSAGDTVTLVKDLDVKGANFTAKRGTAVRNISLVQDNPEHIEGRVNGQQIVILTKYVKKS